MPSATTILGLNASTPGLTSVSSRAPQYLMFHFVFAYGLLSSRTLKQWLGVDNNAAPREDSGARGEEAVRSGKITQSQLNMIRRNEAAHANAVENYTLLVAGLLSAQQAGVSNHIINRAALVYTGARIAYALIYVFIDDNLWSQLRGISWWTGNVSCLYLLWRSAKRVAA